MFTIYIHILEVLAMYTDGTFCDNICAWGSTFEKKDIQKGLVSLMNDGFITKTKLGRVNIWHITDKAIEYCAIVVKRSENAKPDMPLNEMLLTFGTKAQEAQEPMFTENESAPENQGQEGAQGAITDVSESVQALSVLIENEENTSLCETCGRTFIPRVSFDEFQCNSCYEHEPIAEKEYVSENNPDYVDGTKICCMCHWPLVTDEELRTNYCTPCLYDR